MGLAVVSLLGPLLAGAFAQSPDSPSPHPAPPRATEAGAPPPELESAERARQAREHFQAGLVHFRERRFRDAIRAFELAGSLVPSADLWFNIARAHEELGELEPAVQQYRRYLRDRVDPPDRQRVEAHIAALEERIEAERAARRDRPTTGTLLVRATVDGAAIAIDGRPAGQTPLDVPMTLPAGTHRLEVRAEGYVPARAEVSIEPGVHTGAHVRLQPATRYRAVRGRPFWAWIAGGLGVAALGASGYFGVRAAGAVDDDLQAARRFARASDIALGSALACGLGAIVLWFVERRTLETVREVGPAPTR
ncbi:MAG: PEGA domain-containing protein [Myxococcota bacterium]|nr:PEGA domain-containing protein [Myxococcota bacterium]MDW8363098.1 PEGA domain-containing protein [Myxococcales bacterium]